VTVLVGTTVFGSAAALGSSVAFLGSVTTLSAFFESGFFESTTVCFAPPKADGLTTSFLTSFETASTFPPVAGLAISFLTSLETVGFISALFLLKSVLLSVVFTESLLRG